MKTYTKGLLIGAGFIILSAALFTLHYYLFRDSHHIFIYLLGDLAFLPVEVLLVSVIFHKILDDKDKKERLKKINMVVSVFFTEAGVDLMKLFEQNDSTLKHLKSALLIQPEWGNKEYKTALKLIKGFDYHLEFDGPFLIVINEFLTSKRKLFLTLLENPLLMEHESFTDLIMALSHTEQELSKRKNLLELPGSDHTHVMNDIERVYKILFLEWLQFMNHLRKAYPFLYSFSVRTNPFDPNADVEIK